MPDVEHHVVYKAFADFSALYTEVAKAKAALRALKDDESKLRTPGGGTRATADRGREINQQRELTQATTAHHRAADADSQATHRLTQAATAHRGATDADTQATNRQTQSYQQLWLTTRRYAQELSATELKRREANRATHQGAEAADRQTTALRRQAEVEGQLGLFSRRSVDHARQERDTRAQTNRELERERSLVAAIGAETQRLAGEQQRLRTNRPSVADTDEREPTAPRRGGRDPEAVAHNRRVRAERERQLNQRGATRQVLDSQTVARGEQQGLVVEERLVQTRARGTRAAELGEEKLWQVRRRGAEQSMTAEEKLRQTRAKGARDAELGEEKLRQLRTSGDQREQIGAERLQQTRSAGNRRELRDTVQLQTQMNTQTNRRLTEEEKLQQLQARGHHSQAVGQERLTEVETRRHHNELTGQERVRQAVMRTAAMAQRIREQEQRATAGGGGGRRRDGGDIDWLDAVARAGGRGEKAVQRFSRTLFSFRGLVLVVLSVLGPLVATLGALGAAGIGVANVLGSLSGALFALPGLFLAAATGIGALIVAIKPLGAVFTAYTAYQKEAAGGARQLGENQRQAADRTRNAERAYRSASRALTEAQHEERQSQTDLNLARRDALRGLEDLRRELARASLNEEGAVLALKEAERDYRRSLNDPSSTLLDREQALHRLKEAEADLQDVRERNARLAEDAADAERRGIEGAQQVVDARSNAARASQATSDATERLRDASLDLGQAQREQAAGGAQTLKTYEALQDALAKLSPSTRAVVTALFGMAAGWRAVQRNVSERLFAPIVGQLGNVRGLLPVVNDLLGKSAAAIGDVAARGIAMVTSGPWKADFGTLAGTNATLIRNLGDAGLYVAEAFKDITIAATPFTTWVTEAIRSAAIEFAGWAQKARASGDLGKFLDDTRDRLARVWHIVKDLGSTLSSLYIASKDFTTWMLDGTEKMTAGWAKAAREQEKAGSGFRKWLEDTKPLLSTIKEFLGAVSRAFADMAKDPRNMQEAQRVLTVLAERVLPQLVEFFGQLASTGSMSSILEGFANLLEAINKFLASGGTLPLQTFVKTLLALATGLLKLMSTPGVGSIFATLATGLAMFAAAAAFGKLSGFFAVLRGLRWIAGNRGLISGALGGLFGTGGPGGTQGQGSRRAPSGYQGTRRAGSRGYQGAPGVRGGEHVTATYTGQLNTIIGLLERIAGVPVGSSRGAPVVGGVPGERGGLPGERGRVEPRGGVRGHRAPARAGRRGLGGALLAGGALFGATTLLGGDDSDGFDLMDALGIGALGLGALPLLSRGGRAAGYRGSRRRRDATPARYRGTRRAEAPAGYRGTRRDSSTYQGTRRAEAPSGYQGTRRAEAPSGYRGARRAVRLPGYSGARRAPGLFARLGARGAAGLADPLAWAGLGVGLAGEYAFGENQRRTAGAQGTRALGAVLTGAGIGAGIGAVFGGVGAAPGALIGGAAGGAYSLAKDKGLRQTYGDIMRSPIGYLPPNLIVGQVARHTNLLGDKDKGSGGKGSVWDTISSGFKDKVGGPVGDFFTKTLPGWAAKAGEWLHDKIVEPVKKFFTETAPNAVGDFFHGLGRWFTVTLPKWVDEHLISPVENFFTKTLPELPGKIFDAFWFTVGRLRVFFTEQLPEDIGHFFTETLPAAAGGAWNWIKENLLGPIGGFFTETLPDAFSAAWTWFDTNFIKPVWGFFTDTLPNFFTETIPKWFEQAPHWIHQHILDPIFGFFTDTLPNFFTETIPKWFEQAPHFIQQHIIDPVWNFFTNTLPNFFTVTIPKWFSDISLKFYDGFVTPVLKFFQELPGKIGDFLSGSWDKVTDWAKALFKRGAEQEKKGEQAQRGTGRKRSQSGGLVHGTYDGRVDTEPHLLTVGEWVSRKRVVDKPMGKRLLTDLNEERVDPAAFYGALDIAARSPSMPVNARVPAMAGAASTANTNNSGGFVLNGGVTINNPVREPAGDSLYRSVRKLAFEYES